MSNGKVFWLFGLSGAGKTTLATDLLARLRREGRPVWSLDGDELRSGLCRDLGFTVEARLENIRRVAEVARLAASQGGYVVVALITPAETMRRLAVEVIGRDRVDLIWIDVPLEVCRQRDPKGLYRRAAAGDLPLMTGVGAPFEPAAACNLRLANDDVGAMADRLWEFCAQRPAARSFE